jgi:hypothetical protein
VVTVPGASSVAETRAHESAQAASVPNNAPPILVELLHMLKGVQTELAAITILLKKRHIVTDEELNDLRMRISQASEKQLAGAVQHLGRQFAQRPVAGHTEPPADPRRGPSR